MKTFEVQLTRPLMQAAVVRVSVKCRKNLKLALIVMCVCYSALVGVLVVGVGVDVFGLL